MPKPQNNHDSGRISALIAHFTHCEQRLVEEIAGKQEVEVVRYLDEKLVATRDELLSTNARTSIEAHEQLCFFLAQLNASTNAPQDSDSMRAIRILIDRYLGDGEEALPSIGADSKSSQRSLWFEDSFEARVLDQSDNRISMIDTDFHYRYTTSRNSRVYGLTPDEVIGRHTAELIGDKRFFGRAKGFLEGSFKGDEQSYYHLGEGGDLQDRILNCQMKPCFNRAGSITGAVVTMKDVTDELGQCLETIDLVPLKAVG